MELKQFVTKPRPADTHRLQPHALILGWAELACALPTGIRARWPTPLPTARPMKLYYCDNLNNFGDKLNPWLWQRLIPGYLDSDRKTLFVGIGTLLSRRTPQPPTKIVFGSGVGYGEPPKVDGRWRFYCVRGPLSARALGIGADKAISDAALLLRTLDFPVADKVHSVSFMPHHLSARYADWEALCRSVGVNYVDPCAPVETTLKHIRGSRLLITEALHGAVAADAFRVPWIPIRCYHHILEFKWEDWCASLQIPYRPALMQPLWDIGRYGNLLTRMKMGAKRGLASINIAHRRWSPPHPLSSAPADFEQAASRLDDLANNYPPVLSSEYDLESATCRLQTALERFKREWRPASAEAGRSLRKHGCYG